MNIGKTAVVCPVYNERATWISVCNGLREFFDLIVVVDDGSAEPIDGGPDHDFTVLRHSDNLGKGRALETGFRRCLEEGAAVVATLDTDGEHDPRSFRRAFEAYRGEGVLNLSRADIFGTYGMGRRLRNKWISKQISREIGVDLSDTQSGMRLYSAKVIRAALRRRIPPGYAVETEMLRIACAAGLSVRELAMSHPGIPRSGKRYYNPQAFLGDLRVFSSAMLGCPSGKSKLTPAAARTPKIVERF